MTIDDRLREAADALTGPRREVPSFLSIRRRSRKRRTVGFALATITVVTALLIATSAATAGRHATVIVTPTTSVTTAPATCNGGPYSVIDRPFDAPPIGTVQAADGEVHVELTGPVHIPIDHVGKYARLGTPVTLSPAVWAELAPDHHPGGWGLGFAFTGAPASISPPVMRPRIVGDQITLDVSFVVRCFEPGAVFNFSAEAANPGPPPTSATF